MPLTALQVCNNVQSVTGLDRLINSLPVSLPLSLPLSGLQLDVFFSHRTLSG